MFDSFGYKATDIAEYIIVHETQRDSCYSNLKLQRVLYFLQAQFLVEYGKTLFDDEIVAKDFGPIVEAVYKKYIVYGASGIFIPSSWVTVCHIDRQHKKTIDEFLEYVRPYSSADLGEFCKNQTPWKQARNRKNNIISHQDLKEFFEE